MKVSIQLTNIAISLLLGTQMMMIPYPLWAGIKNDKIKVKYVKYKKIKVIQLSKLMFGWVCTILPSQFQFKFIKRSPN